MSETDQAQRTTYSIVDRIRRLIELMKEHDLSEIDLRQRSQRIRLCRGGRRRRGVPPVGAPVCRPLLRRSAPPPRRPPAAVGPPAATGEPPTSSTSAARWSAHSTPAEPERRTVRQGRRPRGSGKDVCIIEAMKVFNEIPAEVCGRIVAVLVEDEEPVEFGKPLFKVDTSK